MVAFAEHRIPGALGIAITLEADLYKVCTRDGLAAECIKEYYPEMVPEQIAEMMTNVFASELLPSIDTPSAEFNAVARAAFRTALKRAIDDALIKTKFITKDHEDEQ